jgi:hypothetical protein
MIVDPNAPHAATARVSPLCPPRFRSSVVTRFDIDCNQNRVRLGGHSGAEGVSSCFSPCSLPGRLLQGDSVSPFTGTSAAALAGSGAASGVVNPAQSCPDAVRGGAMILAGLVSAKAPCGLLPKGVSRLSPACECYGGGWTLAQPAALPCLLPWSCGPSEAFLFLCTSVCRAQVPDVGAAPAPASSAPPPPLRAPPAAVLARGGSFVPCGGDSEVESASQVTSDVTAPAPTSDHEHVRLRAGCPHCFLYPHMAHRARTRTHGVRTHPCSSLCFI